MLIFTIKKISQEQGSKKSSFLPQQYLSFALFVALLVDFIVDKKFSKIESTIPRKLTNL